MRRRLRSVTLRLPRNNTGAYGAGILLSTGSTYVLFVAFALKSTPEVLGLFALWSGAVGIVLQFIDGVSSQRIAQVRPALSVVSPNETGSLNFLNLGRLTIIGAATAAIALPMAFFDLDIAAGIAAFLLGQGTYSLCVSTRVFDTSPKSLLTLQVLKCAVYCIVAVGVVTIPLNLSPGLLMSLTGLASLCPALPFVVRDLIERMSVRLSVRDEFRLLYLSDSWKNLGGLTAYQAVNACGTAVDTLLTSLGGLRTAAEYQVIRRPMLALSGLNVALGQQAINRYSGGSTAGWRRSLVMISPVLILWPGLGLAGLLLVDWFTPDDYDVSVIAGILLAVSYAFGAFLQITGTIVLVRKLTAALFFSSLGRLLVVVLVAVLAVPELGVIGIGLALVVADLCMLICHIIVLIVSDRRASRDDCPVEAEPMIATARDA